MNANSQREGKGQKKNKPRPRTGKQVQAGENSQLPQMLKTPPSLFWKQFQYGSGYHSCFRSSIRWAVCLNQSDLSFALRDGFGCRLLLLSEPRSPFPKMYGKTTPTSLLQVNTFINLVSSVCVAHPGPKNSHREQWARRGTHPVSTC